MHNDLMTRPELVLHFKMCRTTLANFARLHPAFPAARGMRGRFGLYSLAEITAFFAEHAPKYLENVGA